MTYTPHPDDLDAGEISAEVSAIADRILGPTREALEEAGLDPDDPTAPFVHRLLYGDGSDVRIPGFGGSPIAPLLVGVDPGDFGCDVAALRWRVRFDYAVAIRPTIVVPRPISAIVP